MRNQAGNSQRGNLHATCQDVHGDEEEFGESSVTQFLETILLPISVQEDSIQAHDSLLGRQAVSELPLARHKSALQVHLASTNVFLAPLT